MLELEIVHAFETPQVPILLLYMRLYEVLLDSSFLAMTFCLSLAHTGNWTCSLYAGSMTAPMWTTDP